MSEIVGACLSQFHDDPDSFELLLAHADGREIGHVVSRTAAQKIAAEFANEFSAPKDSPNSQVMGIDPALISIAEVMKESGGGWRACSGCYDTEDGHPTQKYDYSPALQTDIGFGCHECGGLGARWEYYSDQDIADMLADEVALSATEGE